ncbi:predicted Lactate-responsive regulator, LysR family [Psychrobacter sp. JCM 18903]|uniref:LysR family transcriptional regulator n=1 Tax=Psychrobacter sp. JCM 18903 TaxID=1298610 RepID=UPI0004354DC8|nr:LysR family transcriptional regulator [Psychrobacter sp. JCM 18903]GAF62281.1 predicted Lactate-responsive regulator, LysR family [Psychrobacter sp. JCM 18903]
MTKADDMILFVQVVEEGSFSRVAEKLSLTNSVVSKRIARLEENLNTQLLYRTTRKLSLTDAGRALYNKAKIAKSAFQEAENAVTGYGEDMKGHIRITMPVVSANFIFSESIAEFCKQHPEVSVELQITNRLVDLIEEGFDLALRTAVLEDSSLIARRLIDSQWIICATPAYLKQYGTPQTPEQLQNHECLVYKFDNTANNTWPLYMDGKEQLISVYGRFYSNHLSAIKQAALSDLGIAFLPQVLIYEEIQKNTLTQILQCFTSKKLGLYAVYPKARQPDQKLKLLVAHLRDSLHQKQAYYC